MGPHLNSVIQQRTFNTGTLIEGMSFGHKDHAFGPHAVLSKRNVHQSLPVGTWVYPDRSWLSTEWEVLRWTQVNDQHRQPQAPSKRSLALNAVHKVWLWFEVPV